MPRCAIYTRKSTEEGLERDFNSLEAQREACAAYVQSQKGAGWRLLHARYDDGGLSGATLERPALQRLLQAVEGGQVDIVIVYKVDRLTRSLTDFAKIVEVFDAKGVSFVSVTQQFNTTTSMGRLTLNVLLSFAQFEREIISERIRDKVAASKKKGLWMGGPVPLGYDVRDRRLVVNNAEARTVRRLFVRYLALGTVRRLKDEADHQGLVTKRRTSRSGRETGGRPFTRGNLYQLLANPIYAGCIPHLGESYPGQHEAIIDLLIHDAIQRIDLSPTEIRLSIRPSALGVQAKEPREKSAPPSLRRFTFPIALRRRGVERKIIIRRGDDHRLEPDPVLCRLIARAHSWVRQLARGEVASVKAIAAREGLDGSDISRILPFAFLAPDIIEAILAGRQPPELTAKVLMRLQLLPADWQAQRRRLGF